jgi:predicted ATP-dependent protease
LSLMAGTLKGLSDHATETRVVIVGVASSIDQLIGEHECVQRAITEVLMPRMSPPEIAEIIAKGFEVVAVTIEEAAQRRVVRLAEELPTYVHMLTLNAAERAVRDDRDEITTADVQAAIDQAVQRHSLVREYRTAVHSPRRNNLFARVLVSCALAEKHRLGQFTAVPFARP